MAIVVVSCFMHQVPCGRQVEGEYVGLGPLLSGRHTLLGGVRPWVGGSGPVDPPQYETYFGWGQWVGVSGRERRNFV